MKKPCTLTGLAVALSMAFFGGALAQSNPTEQEIIKALTRRERGFSRTRSFTGARGVKVTGGEKTAPSIDLKVSFAFDSARLNNESLLTLDALGRALASAALKGQRIEIVGHTDAKGADRVQRGALAAAGRRRRELHRREFPGGRLTHLLQRNGRAATHRQEKPRIRGEPAGRNKKRHADELTASARGVQ